MTDARPATESETVKSAGGFEMRVYEYASPYRNEIVETEDGETERRSKRKTGWVYDFGDGDLTVVGGDVVPADVDPETVDLLITRDVGVPAPDDSGLLPRENAEERFERSGIDGVNAVAIRPKTGYDPYSTLSTEPVERALWRVGTTGLSLDDLNVDGAGLARTAERQPGDAEPLEYDGAVRIKGTAHHDKWSKVEIGYRSADGERNLAIDAAGIVDEDEELSRGMADVHVGGPARDRLLGPREPDQGREEETVRTRDEDRSR